MSNQQANISQVSFFLINLFSVCVCAQLHPALCHIMDSSPPGSSVHGILQARILEWVAISYSRDLPDSRIKPTSIPCVSCTGRQILYHCTTHPHMHTHTHTHTHNVSQVFFFQSTAFPYMLKFCLWLLFGQLFFSWLSIC